MLEMCSTDASRARVPKHQCSYTCSASNKNSCRRVNLRANTRQPQYWNCETTRHVDNALALSHVFFAHARVDLQPAGAGRLLKCPQAINTPTSVFTDYDCHSKLRPVARPPAYATSMNMHTVAGNICCCNTMVNNNSRIDEKPPLP